MGIQNYDRKYITAREHLQKAQVSERNKELILNFVNDRLLDGISKVRLTKYFVVMTLVAKKIEKDLDKVDIADLKQFIGTVQQRSDYSPWTKQMYKVIIRTFYKWHAGTKTYPPLVDWITIRMNRCERNLPSEGQLLTEEDVQKLLAAAEHPRDKAFVAALWESGARISEIGDLKISNVAFDTHGTVISVKGKTGSRKIRLLFSTSHLSTWINSHPFHNNPETPLWVNIGNTKHNKPMDYGGIRIFIQRLFSKAGIKKRCNPHLFRHSRATFMAHHLTEFQMNQYFGWIQGSKMPSTYVHMSGRDVDNAILKMNGMNTEIKKEESKLLPIRCQRCDSMNSNENKFCFKCGGILDMKYGIEIQEKQRKEQEMRSSADELMNMLMKDKDVQALLMEKLNNLNLKNSSAMS